MGPRPGVLSYFGAGDFQNPQVDHRLAQVDRQHRLAAATGARLERLQAGPVGGCVASDDGAQGGLGEVLQAGTALIHSVEPLPRPGREALSKVKLRVETEDGVAAVERAAQLGGVVAAPVDQEVAIDHTVPGPQLNRDTAGYLLHSVCRQLGVFLRGIQAPVAAGDHPQHVVIVQRHVPLGIAGAVLQEVGLEGFQRSHVYRMHVAVPAGTTRMIAHRAAHHHHLRHVRHRVTEQLAGNVESPVGNPEVLDDVGGLLVNQPRSLHHHAGLASRFPLAARWIAGLSLACPDDLLPLQDGLTAGAHGVELVRRNDPGDDQIALVHEQVSVYAHVRTLPRGSLTGIIGPTRSIPLRNAYPQPGRPKSATPGLIARCAAGNRSLRPLCGACQSARSAWGRRALAAVPLVERMLPIRTYGMLCIHRAYSEYQAELAAHCYYLLKRGHTMKPKYRRIVMIPTLPAGNYRSLPAEVGSTAPRYTDDTA